MTSSLDGEINEHATTEFVADVVLVLEKHDCNEIHELPESATRYLRSLAEHRWGERAEVFEVTDRLAQVPIDEAKQVLISEIFPEMTLEAAITAGSIVTAIEEAERIHRQRRETAQGSDDA